MIKPYYDRGLECDKCGKFICYYNLLNPEESQTSGLCIECAKQYGRENDLSD